jgi:hypothetical protein
MSPYVIRQGKRIETLEFDTGLILKKRREPFKAGWVKIPARWIEVLRQSKSIGTYQLAHVILLEAFKRENCGGEIVLSSTVTGMPRTTRKKATKELIELGLIKTEQKGRQAPRVSLIYYYNKKKE